MDRVASKSIGSDGFWDIKEWILCACQMLQQLWLFQEFVRMQPQEQIAVMMLVLEGFAICDPLVEVR